MKVLNFGSLNIDMVYHTSHIVRPGETISSKSLSVHPGGKGANQSAALAKAGAEVYHAGKVGRDGVWLLNKLKSFGVDTEYVTVGDESTGHAIIQLSSDGENTIVLFGGGNKKITREEVLSVLDKFSEGDILLLQNEINLIPLIMKEAHSKGMRIYFNPAPYSPEVHDYPLEVVDAFIVNETEGAGLSGGQEDPEDIIRTLTRKYPGSEVILTLGKDGVLYGQDDLRASAGIVDLPVVDTTAAGDTFIGYYIAERMRSVPVDIALDTSCRASSLTVSRMGAMESIPSRGELAELAIESKYL